MLENVKIKDYPVTEDKGCMSHLVIPSQCFKVSIRFRSLHLDSAHVFFLNFCNMRFYLFLSIRRTSRVLMKITKPMQHCSPLSGMKLSKVCEKKIILVTGNLGFLCTLL